MASTGTRLRWQSYRPLIRCRLPGPQLPAQTARRSVRCASAPAANAAVSSCLTCTQRSLSCRRMESVIPLRESPETPYILATPRATKVSTSTSATAFLPIACPPSSRSERRGKFDRIRTLVDRTQLWSDVVDEHDLEEWFSQLVLDQPLAMVLRHAKAGDPMRRVRSERLCRGTAP